MENQTELHVVINDFEGPLDLLLHLIKETKMDIQEVPMLLIVDQYLAFIRQMETLQLDVAGDYLVMAATLLELKSRLLLPRVETIDEQDDFETPEELEDDLIQQLLAYQQFKEVAHALREKEDERGRFFTKEASNLESLQEAIPLNEGEVTLNDVLRAFEKMFQKQASKQMVQTKIEFDVISVEETIKVIVEKLRYSNTQIPISEFVDSKGKLIATFLAILELTKSKQIQFEQSALGDMIYIAKTEQFQKKTVQDITSGV